MANVVTGAVGGFGPFDEEKPLGVTEYGGGAGLVEGSPTSQSGKAKVGLDHLTNTKSDTERATSAAERAGVAVRAGEDGIDPVTGLSVDDI